MLKIKILLITFKTVTDTFKTVTDKYAENKNLADYF